MSMQRSHAVVKSHVPFVIAPTNISEAMEYSKMIASSCFCPQPMKGKPGDILVAMQMGAEIGLNPLQALQNIAVINGKPCVYGDAALAVVMSSPHYISHKEWFEGSIDQGNLTAFCSILRRNSEEYIKSFSMKEAITAGLWKKPGVWQQYPARMLQMRARSFAIRDKFADALRGINIREEVEDYNKPISASVVSFPKKSISQIEIVVPPANEDDLDIQLMDFTDEINQTTDIDSLAKTFEAIKKVNWGTTDYLKKLIDLKDAKKSELLVKEFKDEFDSVTGEVIS